MNITTIGIDLAKNLVWVVTDNRRNFRELLYFNPIQESKKRSFFHPPLTPDHIAHESKIKEIY